MSADNRTIVCPNCGSVNVRWRRRRIYDFVFTYLRYFIDTTAGVLFGGNRTTVVGSRYSERATEARLEGLQYAEEREFYEDRVGTMTASRFWNCPDCRQKGQVFDNLDGVIRERERLTGLEGEIGSNLGTVNNPIGPNDPKSN